MLPRWHIFFGAIFTSLIWIFSPGISLVYLTLIFLASFLIDFDHYVVAALKTKKISLQNALNYYKIYIEKEKKEVARGIRKKGDFHLFHTIEFHAAVGVAGLFFIPFFYVFIGMLFHSMLDLISLSYNGTFHRREFFLVNWARKI